MRSAPFLVTFLILVSLIAAGCLFWEEIALAVSIPAPITGEGSYQYGGTAVAISVKSEDVSTHSPLAQILFFKALALSTQYAEYNESIPYFDKALTVDENFTVAWVGRGVTFHNLHRYAEAVSSYDRALALNGSDATVWQLKGITLNDMGEESEAAECTRSAVALATAGKGK
ncbi:MAG: hypothetical protein METHP_00634 [Methanoregula sp. SKADARSKE-2]|nr:MAG: hypothetical protein METHP_00634 [Methanoregula sp. SKADARSKE-2]